MHLAMRSKELCIMLAADGNWKHLRTNQRPFSTSTNERNSITLMLRDREREPLVFPACIGTCPSLMHAIWEVLRASRSEVQTFLHTSARPFHQPISHARAWYSWLGIIIYISEPCQATNTTPVHGIVPDVLQRETNKESRITIRR